jgi:glycosyltransferase involved in cell wall biosynthesis
MSLTLSSSRPINQPLVTVITVNYNSKKIQDIVAASIHAILNLNYRPLEIIIVDNGSEQGTFEYIKDLVNDSAPAEVTVRFLELPKNYGFAIANNIAFAQRSHASQYVALINNDLLPEPDSLKKLVEYLEENGKVGGVQGGRATPRTEHTGETATGNRGVAEAGRGRPKRAIYSDGAGCKLSGSQVQRAEVRRGGTCPSLTDRHTPSHRG